MSDSILDRKPTYTDDKICSFDVIFVMVFGDVNT